MIAIVDYGFGNLRSVSKALSLLSIDSKITDSKNVIEDSALDKKPQQDYRKLP